MTIFIRSRKGIQWCIAVTIVLFIFVSLQDYLSFREKHPSLLSNWKLLSLETLDKNYIFWTGLVLGTSFIYLFGKVIYLYIMKPIYMRRPQTKIEKHRPWYVTLVILSVDVVAFTLMCICVCKTFETIIYGHLHEPNFPLTVFLILLPISTILYKFLPNSYGEMSIPPSISPALIQFKDIRSQVFLPQIAHGKIVVQIKNFRGQRTTVETLHIGPEFDRSYFSNIQQAEPLPELEISNLLVFSSNDNKKILAEAQRWRNELNRVRLLTGCVTKFPCDNNRGEISPLHSESDLPSGEFLTNEDFPYDFGGQYTLGSDFATESYSKAVVKRTLDHAEVQCELIGVKYIRCGHALYIKVNAKKNLHLAQGENEDPKVVTDLAALLKKRKVSCHILESFDLIDTSSFWLILYCLKRHEVRDFDRVLLLIGDHTHLFETSRT